MTEENKLFFRVIAPMVLRINELILEDRGRASDLTERLDHGQSVTPGDQAWLTELLLKCKVLESTNERLKSDPGEPAMIDNSTGEEPQSFRSQNSARSRTKCSR